MTVTTQAAYEMQVKVRDRDSGNMIWRSVHPSNGAPYRYANYDDCYRQLEACYPNSVYGETVRVVLKV